MALQQLDLFGNIIEQAPVKKKPAKQVVKAHKSKPAEEPEAVAPPAHNIIKAKGKRGRKSNKEMYLSADLINIPDDTVLDQKLYYSISEVAVWFNVNTSQIRFWEKEFDILKPRKNKKGDRLFKKEDIKNLQLIYYLLRNKKYSIEGAKEYLQANAKKVSLHQDLANMLNTLRSFLLELKANLES